MGEINSEELCGFCEKEDNRSPLIPAGECLYVPSGQRVCLGCCSTCNKHTMLHDEIICAFTGRQIGILRHVTLEGERSGYIEKIE